MFKYVELSSTSYINDFNSLFILIDYNDSIVSDKLLVSINTKKDATGKE